MLVQFEKDLHGVPKIKVLGILKTKYNIEIGGLLQGWEVWMINLQLVYLVSLYAFELFGGYRHDIAVKIAGACFTRYMQGRR